jgi:anthranilate phosphoribosyltransferase
VGIGFLYAPLFNGPLSYTAAPRQEIGIRTLFNLLGPLTNPAGAKTQVLGVYAPELTGKLAEVLRRLGTQEALVVYGEGTFDEISLSGPTRISRLKDGAVRTFTLTPEDVGLKTVPLEALCGGQAEDNARIIREVLNGTPGPRREVVLLNAAAAFMAAGLETDFRGGLERAGQSIDSGQAGKKLETLIEFTRHCRPYIRE